MYKEDNMEKIKVMIAALFGAVTSALGALAVPVFLLVACNFIDYITGIAASKFRNQKISSYVGIWGIVKKVCMWLLIVVGVVLDKTILYAAETVGWTLPFTFAVACFVALWLICNEVISILENINDIGVPLPSFLMPIVEQLKSQIEDKTEIKNYEEQEDE